MVNESRPSRMIGLRSMKDGRSVWVDDLVPGSPTGPHCLLINSLFDETDHCYNFLTGCAARLSSIGVHTTMFDYYGTGDSAGEFYEMNIEKNLNDIGELGDNATLVGIRWGATLAIEAALKMGKQKKLVLIEPVASGKKFVSELKFKIALAARRPTAVAEYGITMHDFIGYPITNDGLERINSINILNSGISGTEIILVKLRYMPSRTAFDDLAKGLSKSNDVKIHHVDCNPIWLGHMDSSSLQQTVPMFL